ncbi:MAG: transglycosylase SLT domain-containing protein [Deltaproteobacteria bacterium]|nr:transglycosylase SLT domain-containing protein [Deltaproteobacteria bacterium]
MLLRLGLPSLLLAVAPLGRGCVPDTTTSVGAEQAEAVVEAPTPEPEPATPPPPARASLAPSEVRPAAPETADGQAGGAVKAAIVALEDGRFDDALTLAPRLDGGPLATLSDWTRARALRALDRPDEAFTVLSAVPEGGRYSSEALLARSEISLELGRADQSLELLGPPRDDGYDSFEARADLIRARAYDARRGKGDVEAAVAAAKRVWRGAPGSQADGDAKVLLGALEPKVGQGLRRSLVDSVARAKSLGTRHGKKSIVKLLSGETEAMVTLGATDPATACTGLFELGRAYHKQRTYGESVPVLSLADSLCAGNEKVKTVYLLAQGKARSGNVSGGITTFVRLADDHAEHTYADDGLWQASRLALDEGRNDEAARHAQRLVDEFPDGDMRGSTLWNLAWSALADGRPMDALPWLEVMAAGDPRGHDREHVLQGRYWQARVLLKSAPERSDEALRALELLATEHPLHWYGTLGGWLLSAKAPDRAAAVDAAVRSRAGTMQAAAKEPARFEPLQEFVDLPGVTDGMVLLRAGLGEEAAQEFARALGTKPHETWADPATLLFAAHLYEEAGDPARSHNLLRRACKTAFPEAEPAQAATLTHAWPRAFAAEIDGHTADYDWDSLLFQGLVREESAFSPTVVSWAGAIGLSQLMWPTAKETARRMGIRVRRADLNDPSLNVRIGTTYFDGLAKRWNGHLPLAVASYNAGPGAVKRWVDARGHLELDAWVETIPYDQTRHYVKRVVSSWQAYAFLYGDTGGWVPLRVGPVAQAIKGSDPTVPPASSGG